MGVHLTQGLGLQEVLGWLAESVGGPAQVEKVAFRGMSGVEVAAMFGAEIIHCCV